MYECGVNVIINLAYFFPCHCELKRSNPAVLNYLFNLDCRVVTIVPPRNDNSPRLPFFVHGLNTNGKFIPKPFRNCIHKVICSINPKHRGG